MSHNETWNTARRLVSRTSNSSHSPSSPALARDFPPTFFTTAKHIYKQLMRVFAHIYHAQFPYLIHLCCEGHFNSLFAHFVAFGAEFELFSFQEVRRVARRVVETVFTTLTNLHRASLAVQKFRKLDGRRVPGRLRLDRGLGARRHPRGEVSTIESVRQASRLAQCVFVLFLCSVSICIILADAPQRVCVRVRACTNQVCIAYTE